MPNRLKSSGSRSGAGEGMDDNAARPIRVLAVLARASILLTRSTLPALRLAMVSLSKACAAEPSAKLAAVVAPMALKVATVGFCPGVASVAEPFASARIRR